MDSKHALQPMMQTRLSQREIGSWDLPVPRNPDSRRHVVTAPARARLRTRPNLWESTGAPFAGPLRGQVDLVSPRVISGWAQNPQNPEAPVCLDIYAGDRLIGQVLANRHRPDLAVAGLGSGRHGFSFTAPAGSAFAPHAMQVCRSVDGAILDFGATTSCVQAA